MERLTKVTVTLWACAAIALQAWLLRSWSSLPWLTAAAAITALILARIDRRSLAIVFAVTYLFPTLVHLGHGVPYEPFAMLWLAMIVGAILPDALTRGWALPRWWRAALVFAALVVAVSATVSIWRETEGMPGAVLDLGAPIWFGIVPPSFPVRWILNVALILVVGILWFDWLLSEPGLDFEAVVITPLVFSAAAMALVSAYQMFVDIRFLNPTVFAGLGRATGTMYDGNAAGMIGALWIGGTFLWARRGRTWRRWAAVPLIAADGVAVWASGSRTATVAATTIVLGCMAALIMAKPGARLRRFAIAGTLAALLVAGILGVGSANPQALNPAARIWDTIVTHPSVGDFLDYMWTRNGYGTAAIILLKESPVVGVGVGSFHAFVSDVGRRFPAGTPPDNAQNWLRHQLVEFGLLGGVGWAIWYAVFGWFVLVPRRGEPADVWIARGLLVGLAVTSLVGMPGQEVMVALTFWTLAYWYVRLKGQPAGDVPLRSWVWTTIGVATLVFTVGTFWVSATTFRPVQRERDTERRFSAGFELAPAEGPNRGFRRMTPHAVALLQPSLSTFAVRVKNSPDRGPVDVRVTCNGEPLLKARVEPGQVVEAYTRVQDVSQPILVEFAAGPATRFRWWPLRSDSGVLVNWEFVNSVPSQFRRAESLDAATPSRGVSSHQE